MTKILVFLFLLIGLPGAHAKLCDNAKNDGVISWHERLGHSSFDLRDRDPFGAVPTNDSRVYLAFATCASDVEAVRLRLWIGSVGKEKWFDLKPKYQIDDDVIGLTQIWELSLGLDARPEVYYYFFEIADRNQKSYYVAKDPRTLGGGRGRFLAGWDAMSSFQISVYEREFSVPEWLKGAVIYQIFPDRFRNANPKNDPPFGDNFVFGQQKTMYRWDEPLCDPMLKEAHCYQSKDSQFYGGDLEGVIGKLDYIDSLGVNVIYFNPIFQAATNHKYDTQNHFSIDRNLGGDKIFERLLFEASKRNIRIILDGVFNHISSDSGYFDLYERWNGVGACESEASVYRNWFYIPAQNKGNIARNKTGGKPWQVATCPGGAPSAFWKSLLSTTYEGWAGYFELAVLNLANPEVKDFLYKKGPDSVAGYWMNKGAFGWRMDVAGLIDPGKGSPGNNNVWEDVSRVIKTQNPESIMLGEEWGNASAWLLGDEWDTTMNYRFRTSVLNWMFDGCEKDSHGCTDGVVFEDNDMNFGSSHIFLGPIQAISETDFDIRLNSIRENYPNEAWLSAMNLLGGHDTNRILFLLKKGSWDDLTLAKRKLFFLAIFQLTYPGAPTIYYGDEAGLLAEGKWADGRWYDDPYNRAPYPWQDKGLSPNKELISHYRKLGKLRSELAPLKLGDLATLYVDSKNRVYAFIREHQNEQVIVVLNRSFDKKEIELPLAGWVQPGAEYIDRLNSKTKYKVVGESIKIKLPGLWGAVLVKER